MDTSEPETEMREQIEVMVAGGYLPLDQIEFDAADYLTGAYEELDDEALADMTYGPWTNSGQQQRCDLVQDQYAQVAPCWRGCCAADPATPP